MLRKSETGPHEGGRPQCREKREDVGQSVRFVCIFLLFKLLSVPAARAQDKVAAPMFSHPHGLYEEAFTLTLTCADSTATIVYTTDGSLPDDSSPRYTAPLHLDTTTLVRARALVGNNGSRTVTASYLFIYSILHQPDSPTGFPETWGPFATRPDTAMADYGMDRELIGDTLLAAKVVEGLRQLPIVSLTTERTYFFGKEPDPERGGLYIHTGVSEEGHPGRGWERPVSFELFGGTQGVDLQADCGVRIHGGQSRLPEKSPKHSLRLTWRTTYGSEALYAPLFGRDEPDSFRTLILRASFNNTWLHSDAQQREAAQYNRDQWARTLQQRMGHPAAGGFWAHLFMDGLYWGMYNVSERIDKDFCASHLGGSPEEWDVVKGEESPDGQHYTASEGNLKEWEEMLATASQAAQSNSAYYRLEGRDANGKRDASLPPLLDVDNFIDYMILNQYAGNTDWDIHNWYAVRRRSDTDTGFQFLCWDTEMILGARRENVLTPKGFRRGVLSGLLSTLMENALFRDRFQQRVALHCTADGILTPDSVTAVWDNLSRDIIPALYAESARWGDYRRDNHPGKGRAKLYTVETTYAAERRRLYETYFPSRTAIYLQQLHRRGWYR